MNIAAVSDWSSDNTNFPPKYMTTTNTQAPRNSLIGDARSVLRYILFMVVVYFTFRSSNLSCIGFSALNALMMRRPDNVSSMMLSNAPNLSLLLTEVRFRLFPIWVINNAVNGNKMKTKMVSCGLM